MKSDNCSLLSIIEVTVAELLFCSLDEAHEITIPANKVYSLP